MKTFEAILLFSVVMHLIIWSWSAASHSGTTKKTVFQNPQLIEAESLSIVAQSRTFPLLTQDTSQFGGGLWSGDQHFFAQETKLGDWVEFGLPVSQQGDYRVVLFLSHAYDYGILKASLNGVESATKINLFSGDGQIYPSGPVILGTFALSPQKNRLRLELVGTDPASAPPRFQFGIDGVKLLPVANSK